MISDMIKPLRAISLILPRLTKIRACWLCSLMFATAAALPMSAGDSLPGGRRALDLELNGAWIGNGVSFSPYRDGQSQAGPVFPSEEQIAEDLHLIMPYWKLIRMYESKTVTERTLRIMAREKLPMRLILGIWINPAKTAETRATNAREIANGIRLANTFPHQVAAVLVGNENCVDWSDHRTIPAEMIAHIQEVRAAVRQPVGMADDYNFWNKPESKAVAAVLDYIDLHAYALWNGQPLDQAMEWLAGVYDKAVQFHAGTPVMIGETGWATQNDIHHNGPYEEGTLMKAEVSVAAQEVYLRQHYRWVNENRVPTLLFEAFDENWKGGGDKNSPETAEKHWGVFDSKRRPKASFQAIVREFYPATR
jgi:exo-beta-1,3-glucanase (GH17 family)